MSRFRFSWPIVSALVALAALAGCSRSSDHGGDAGRATDAALSVDDPSNGGAMWGANYFPNIPLTSMNGEKVKFFDDLVKDKVVAINFIYTKCADACPMETARLLEVQKLLGDRLGKDIFFVSISIDPAHDTPEVLKSYSQLWHTGPGWTFYTGKDEDITLLRKKLGIWEEDLKKKDHNLSMLIGNQKTGRWMKRSPYENPYVLASQLGSWLSNWKLPQPTDRNYADAPKVRNISAAEEMFRARCTSCHTIGGGDINALDERRVGPDLLNVGKQRDKAWLLHWMMRPDEMLAQKDALAMKLFAEYKEINMPNLRLTQDDAESLLGYIAEESKAVERRAELMRIAAKSDGGAASVTADAGPAATPAPSTAANH